MLDAVLLDWEGVLADTALARRDALLSALGEEGLHLDTATYGEVCAGHSVHASVQHALTSLGRNDNALAALVTLRASRAFRDRLQRGMTLTPGARAFVARMQLASRVGVVTCSSRAEMEIALRLSELEDAMATVVSADDVLDEPPSPSAYLLALDNLSRLRAVQHDRVVAIAASLPALRAARAAGLRTIAVAAPAHVALEADGAVDSVDALTVRELSRLAGVSATERQR